MKQKIIVAFTGTDSNPTELEGVDKYLKDGWVIKQTSTAYFDRASIGKSVAVTLLLEK